MYFAISCHTDFQLSTLRFTQAAVSVKSRFSSHTTHVGTYSTYIPATIALKFNTSSITNLYGDLLNNYDRSTRQLYDIK